MRNPLSQRLSAGNQPSAPGSSRSGVVPAVRGADSRRQGALSPVRRFALLLDDDEASLRTFERLLSKHPVEILSAQTPSEALGLVSMLEQTPQPIVAFLDVLVPGMDGARFVHALRTMPCFGAAPVVLVSALSANALDGKALEWGASGIIQKSRGLLHVAQEFSGWLERIA